MRDVESNAQRVTLSLRTKEPMTRKDYVALAEALRAAKMMVSPYDAQTWYACVANIADTLAAENSRFDRARFVKACEGK